MIKDPNFEMLRISVELNDGTKHERCDTTSKPFGGEGHAVVAVWVGEVIKIYPMAQVKSMTLHFD